MKTSPKQTLLFILPRGGELPQPVLIDIAYLLSFWSLRELRIRRGRAGQD